MQSMARLLVFPCFSSLYVNTYVSCFNFPKRWINMFSDSSFKALTVHIWITWLIWISQVGWNLLSIITCWSCTDIRQGDTYCCGRCAHHLDYRDNPFIIWQYVTWVRSFLCGDVIARSEFVPCCVFVLVAKWVCSLLLLSILRWWFCVFSVFELLPKLRHGDVIFVRDLINRQNYHGLPKGQYCCVVMEMHCHMSNAFSQSNPHWFVGPLW